MLLSETKSLNPNKIKILV